MLDDNLIFDIGANRGEVAKKYIEEGYKVVCVEPLSDLCEFMKNRFKDYENFVCVNKLVSSDSGSKTFYRGQADTLSTTSTDWMTKSRFKNYAWYDIGEVDCISLDSLVETYGVPKFIKIDAEGSELEVIKSLTEKVDSVISFEWVQEFPEKSIDIITHLESLGFTEHFIYNHPRKNRLQEDFIENNSNFEFNSIKDFKDDLTSNLDDIPGDPAWGDIYVR